METFKSLPHIRCNIANLYFSVFASYSVKYGGLDHLYERTNDRHTLYIINEGTCSLEINQKTYALKKGMYAFVPANTPYRVFNLSDNIERIMISMKFIPQKCTLEKNIINTVKNKHVYNISDNFKNMLNLISDYSTIRCTGYVSVVENAISIIIFEFLNTINVPLLKNSNDEKKETTTTADEIILFVRNNAASKLTANDVATYFNMSVRQLDRLMIKKLNVTTKRLIDSSKLRLAKDLIINSQYSLFELSIHLGFSSSHSFSVFFKRLTGITPFDFMKKNRP